MAHKQKSNVIRKLWTVVPVRPLTLSESYTLAEWQANRALSLMGIERPHVGLGWVGLSTYRALKSSSDRASKWTVLRSDDLQPWFNVSEEAMDKRLRFLGLLDDDTRPLKTYFRRSGTLDLSVAA